MVSSSEKNDKYFIGYEDDDYKFKPLNIMLPKSSAHVKSYDSKTKLKMLNYRKNILIFGLKLVIVLKKNLTVNPSTLKKFWKPKQDLTVMRLQVFVVEKYKEGSNYICSSVVIIDSVLKKDENYYPQVF